MVTKKTKYFYDHFPKTAGTTLRMIFEQILGEENISPHIVDNANAALAYLSDYQMIVGHFSYLPELRLHPDRFYITMLRHPYDQLLSQYYFHRYEVQEVNQHMVSMAKKLDLLEFLESQALANSYVHHYAPLSMTGYEEGPDLLECAKRSLNQFDFIGIFEHLEDSIDLLCYQLEWPPVHAIPHANLTGHRRQVNDLDDRTLLRLRELTNLDVQLYEFALESFQANKRRMMAECILQKSNKSIYESEEQVRQKETFVSACGHRVEGEFCSSELAFGNRKAEVLDVTIIGTRSQCSVISSGEEAEIDITISAHEDIPDLVLGFLIRNKMGQKIFGTNTYHLGHKLPVVQGKKYVVKFLQRMDLGPDEYLVTVALHLKAQYMTDFFHWRNNVARFTVTNLTETYFQGVARLYPKVRHYEPLPFEDYAADLTACVSPASMSIDEVATIPIRVKNLGKDTWAVSGLTPVCLSYHWLDSSYGTVVHDGLRTSLPGDFPSGKEAVIRMKIQALGSPGRYILRITLVHERTAWFEDYGMKPVDMWIDVIGQPIR
jgi:hypothetical protein